MTGSGWVVNVNRQTNRQSVVEFNSSVVESTFNTVYTWSDMIRREMTAWGFIICCGRVGCPHIDDLIQFRVVNSFMQFSSFMCWGIMILWVVNGLLFCWNCCLINMSKSRSNERLIKIALPVAGLCLCYLQSNGKEEVIYNIVKMSLKKKSFSIFFGQFVINTPINLKDLLWSLFNPDLNKPRYTCMSWLNAVSNQLHRIT